MKILLFDMMETLVSEPYPVAFDWLLKKRNISFEEFQSYRNTETYLQFESGFIGEYELYRDYYRSDLDAEIKKTLPLPAKIKKELFKKVSYLAGINDFLTELFQLRDSRLDFKIGIASNYSVWYHQILDKLPLLTGPMDYLFFSCEMGHRKPGREYYLVIQNGLATSLDSEELDIYFADDRTQNLIIPKRLGWVTHQMQDVVTFRQSVLDFLA